MNIYDYYRMSFKLIMHLDLFINKFYIVVQLINSVLSVFVLKYFTNRFSSYTIALLIDKITIIVHHVYYMTLKLILINYIKKISKKRNIFFVNFYLLFHVIPRVMHFEFSLNQQLGLCYKPVSIFLFYIKSISIFFK